MRRLLFAACLFLGCGDDATGDGFSLRFVDSSGGNPTLGTDVNTIEVSVKQGQASTQMFSEPVVDGDFELDIELLSLVTPVQLVAEFGGGTDRLLGSFPSFVPVSVSDGLNIVVGRPSSCAAIEGLGLQAARSGGGAMLFERFVFLAGGSAGEPDIEFVDLAQLRGVVVDDFEVDSLGTASVAQLDLGVALVVPENGAAFVFRLTDPTNRIQTLSLHEGVGPKSAIVTLPEGGVVVVGGDDSASASASIVNTDGEVTDVTLSTARQCPSAAVVGGNVLIVGGDVAGSAEYLVSSTGVSTALPVPAGERNDGVLVASPDAERALWLGGVDGVGVQQTDSVLFSNCPACTSTAGPAWPNARSQVVVAPNSQLLVGGTDSALIEQVVFGSTVELNDVATLSQSRALSAPIVFPSGVVVVMGGRGAGDVLLSDVEFCFPPELNDPL